MYKVPLGTVRVLQIITNISITIPIITTRTKLHLKINDYIIIIILFLVDFIVFNTACSFQYYM